MPDIGLLQGPPPRRAGPPVATREPEPQDGARPAEPAAVTGELRLRAAHAAVVSDAPFVRKSAPLTLAMDALPEPAVASAAQSPPPAEPESPTRASPPMPPVLPVPAPPPIRVADLLWLLLALALIIGTGLGIRDPWPADEPRFASLARDLLHSGEWLFPRVGGDLYQDKPPLFFWLLAASYALFGGLKAWFLIPATLAAAGVLFLIYDFGRRTVSREAGLGAAIAVLCTLHFVVTLRGAQIDPVLCFLTTLSSYALLRHLLLGHGWGWYFLGGLCAGLGVITKGVGFLPLLLLIPFFLLRGCGWQGLARLDAGRGGWRWWLAPLAMLLGISVWFVPMLLAVAASGSPDYLAYRDEILFKQTVGRYAASWHHVKGWHYFLVEVIPPLWLPWSLMLFWLVPGFARSFRQRDARVWLPLCWVLLVLLFFTLSPGKRGIYILPALPLLAIASLPLLPDVLARPGVRRAGWVLALGFGVAGLAALIANEFDWFGHAADAAIGTLPVNHMLLAFVLLCALGMIWARWRAPLAAWPATLAALCVSFSYFLAPSMNGERSGRDFMVQVLTKVRPGEELGLVAYKEQFLLYLDRPVVNFGHRRWQEGSQEFFDAAAWLNGGGARVLLVPEAALNPKDRFKPAEPAVACFSAQVAPVGRTSDEEWFLVRAPAESGCAGRGNAARAIRYAPPPAR